MLQELQSEKSKDSTAPWMTPALEVPRGETRDITHCRQELPFFAGSFFGSGIFGRPPNSIWPSLKDTVRKCPSNRNSIRLLVQILGGGFLVVDVTRGLKHRAFL